MPYDSNNEFAKILRGDINLPEDKIVYQNDFALSFVDPHPQAPVHVLVIPKGDYTNLSDFTARASSAEILGFWNAVSEVTKRLRIDKSGYRLITNCGKDAEQHVQHMHVHIIGGGPLSPLWPARSVNTPHTPT